MADLLTRMAERALGLAPTVQPIIAPMFAPGLPLVREHAPGSLAGDAALGEQPGVLEAPEQEHLQAPAHRPSQMVAPQPHLVPLRHEELGGRTYVDSMIQLTTNRRNDPPTFKPEPPVGRTEDSPSVQSQVEHQFTPDADEHGEHLVERGIGSNIEPLLVLEPPQNVGSAVHGQPEVFQTPQQLTPGAVKSDVQQALAPIKFRSEAVQTQSTLAEKPSSAAVPPPEPATPTIRVSIGRIDVRAVTPPASSAQRPAAVRPGPALSLDDYLKQQKGGRR
jgi:hypothetical protein